MNSFFDLTHTLYFLLRERAMSLLLTQVWKVFIFIQIIDILIKTIFKTYISPYSPDVPTLRFYQTLKVFEDILLFLLSQPQFLNHLQFQIFILINFFCLFSNFPLLFFQPLDMVFLEVLLLFQLFLFQFLLNQ